MSNQSWVSYFWGNQSLLLLLLPPCFVFCASIPQAQHFLVSTTSLLHLTDEETEVHPAGGIAETILCLLGSLTTGILIPLNHSCFSPMAPMEPTEYAFG